MRSSKQRSRAKNRGGNRSPANNINRVFDSSGPEGKVRGTPQQIIDKYTQLARDAFLAGDRVAGENFQQHAEHYTRLLSEAQRDAEEKRQQADQQNRERQQQKQRERSREAAAQTPTQPQPRPAAEDDGAQVVDLGNESRADSGLVDTPEEQPQKKPARRKPRSRAAKAQAESGDAPEPTAATGENTSPPPDANAPEETGAGKAAEAAAG